MSGEVNTSVASHLVKLPWMATEAFTKNLMLLSTGVIEKTGASARLREGSTADAKRQSTESRILPSLRLLKVAVNSQFIEDCCLTLRFHYSGQRELRKDAFSRNSRQAGRSGTLVLVFVVMILLMIMVVFMIMVVAVVMVVFLFGDVDPQPGHRLILIAEVLHQALITEIEGM